VAPGLPQVPGYELLERIGEGGMGLVYRARQVRAGRLVALKTMRTAFLANPELRRRFHDEAEHMAGLRHPNVVQVFEVGDRPVPFFSMELIEGGSLEGRLRQETLRPREAAALLAQVARAVHHAHEQGIVHRDLKPANVLLSAACGLAVPKVTDFGLARRLDGQGGTAAGLFIGTAAYAAPEQAECRKDIGPAADTWALGAILYECLTGRPPFRAATMKDTLSQVVSTDPVPPSRLAADCPADLEAVCLKCLEKSPDRRYASAAELADDLASFLRGEPTGARPLSYLGRALRWVRRRPAVAALLGVTTVAALALVGVVVALLVNVRLDEARQLAEEASANAKQQRQRAERGERAAGRHRALAERLQYATDMNLAQQAFRENRLFRMRDLLARHEKAEHLKGFEWHYLWELCRAKLVCGPKHRGVVRAVGFSPDGRRAVSGSREGGVQIWDAATGRLLVSLAGHKGTVNGVAFSPDGKRVASAGFDGMVKVWDAATGRELFAVSLASVLNGLAFSPDGRFLAVADDGVSPPPDRDEEDEERPTGDGVAVILLDAHTGKRLARWQGHKDSVTAVCFSPDGKWLASASEDNTVKLWDVAAGKLVRTLQGNDEMTAVAFSPDGKRLAASAEPVGDIILWDPANGKELHRYQGQPSRVVNLSFSPDGRQLASAEVGGTARIHDLATDRPATVLYGPGGVVNGAVFSPDGTRLLLGGPGASAQVWNLNVGEGTQMAALPSDGAEAFAQSRDGRWLAHGGEGCVLVWDAHTRRKVHTLTGHQGSVKGVGFSPDGQWLVSGGVDGVARVWRVKDGALLRQFQGHKAPIRSLAYDPLGRFVATGDGDSAVKIWDPRSGREMSPPLMRTGVQDLAFRPDGRRLAVAASNEIYLYDPATWKLIRTLRKHDSEFSLRRLAFSPRDGRVAAAMTEGTIVLWDEAQENPVAVLPGHNAEARSLAFTSDGRRLASGGFDGSLYLWDLETEQPVLILRNTRPALSLAFDPTGRRLAVASYEAIALWSAGAPPGGR
jgi:WD40 repeat protein